MLVLPNAADTMAITGLGTRDAPYILPACENLEGIFARLRWLRRMEAGINASWKVLDWGVPRDFPVGHEKVRFRRRVFTDSEVLSDTMAFYFDVSSVANAKPPSHSPIVWSDQESIEFPHDLAWLHFDDLKVNAAQGTPLDVSLFYSSVFGKASIYVYGSCDDGDEQRIRAEAEKAIEGAKTANPDATTPWEPASVGPLYGQFLLMPKDLSFAGVTSRGGKFIKLRITVTDGEQVLREMLNECLHAICLAIDGRAISWAPAAH